MRWLVLASKDMELAAGAAEALASGVFRAVERELEIGLVITYARAYTADSKRRVIGDEWLPETGRPAAGYMIG